MFTQRGPATIARARPSNYPDLLAGGEDAAAEAEGEGGGGDDDIGQTGLAEQSLVGGGVADLVDSQ